MRGRPAKVCSQVEIRSHSVDTAPHQKQPPSYFLYGSQPQTHQMRLFCMHSLMEVDVMRSRTRNRVSVLLEAEVLQFWPNSVCTSRMGPAPIPENFEHSSSNKYVQFLVSKTDHKGRFLHIQRPQVQGKSWNFDFLRTPYFLQFLI